MAEGTFNSELPIATPIKIVPGTDFAGQLIQHDDVNDQPIDTSGWTFPGAGIYDSACCDAELILDLSDKIQKEPATPWGYQIVIAAVDSNLPCGEYFYKIPALQDNNGDKLETFIAGEAVVSLE